MHPSLPKLVFFVVVIFLIFYMPVAKVLSLLYGLVWRFSRAPFQYLSFPAAPGSYTSPQPACPPLQAGGGACAHNGGGACIITCWNVHSYAFEHSTIHSSFYLFTEGLQLDALKENDPYYCILHKLNQIRYSSLFSFILNTSPFTMFSCNLVVASSYTINFLSASLIGTFL